MQVHNLRIILKNARLAVAKSFPCFGVNKRQEITRLLFEIAKRDNIPPGKILKDAEASGFSVLKKRLLERRFPCAAENGSAFTAYLPQVKLNPKNAFSPEESAFYPQNIFVEKAASNSRLFKRLKEKYPQADAKEINTIKDYLAQERQAAKISSYNARRKNIFVTAEQYDFFKKCPCTKGALACGYHIFNLGFGCIFDCAYCYLQEYANTPGIILAANLDTFFAQFRRYKRKGMRLGSGEFSDSLMLDNVTEYSLLLIDFFKYHPDVTFEFKTKSANIANLLKAPHAGNIVASWSLNPQKIIDENEFFTASLPSRIKAMAQCAESGYKIGIHFDPVIYFEGLPDFGLAGWQEEYQKLITMLFAKIRPRHIAWISLGTFRFKPELKTIIEQRFCENKILNEELLIGYDGKLRYPYKIRYAIYDYILRQIARHKKNLPVYLCMEELSMRKDLKMAPQRDKAII